MEPQQVTKIHQLTAREAYQQGYKDGRYEFHDTALWQSLSRPKRAAYDRGNQNGRQSPIRC